MLTAGDVQFEPQQSKIWRITTSIALLVAGDISLHSEIYNRLLPLVKKKIEEQPPTWIEVLWTAESYSRIYYELRSERIEKEILFPLGLNSETFISRQKELSSSIIDDIAYKINKLFLPSVGAIIAGNDKNPDPIPNKPDNGIGSPHLYIFDNGRITCNDKVGFAAIGAGYWHANSQFMFNGHTRSASEPVTLLNTYWAKKRAEVAPGVGVETDMFVISPHLGSYEVISEKIINDVDKIYQKNQKSINKMNSSIENSLANYLAELIKTRKQQSSPPTPELNLPIES